MITLFRKVRQKLLPENKFSKYLPYAIGKIVMLVIGIVDRTDDQQLEKSKKENVIARTSLASLNLSLK